MMTFYAFVLISSGTAASEDPQGYKMERANLLCPSTLRSGRQNGSPLLGGSQRMRVPPEINLRGKGERRN